MSEQFTNAQAERKAKRERLRDLVARLGPDAKPAQIREHAYREGIGQINAQMLCHVRNDVQPNRSKRTGGQAKGWKAAAAILASSPNGPESCPVCGSARTRVKETWTMANGKVRRIRICKDCQHSFVRDHDDVTRVIRTERLAARAIVEKECTGCKRMLPVACFGKRAGDADLYRPRCRECTNEDRSKHYKKTRCAQSAIISPEEYDALVKKQADQCAICGSKDKGKRFRLWPVDHCHTTGKVRGLLCSKCNLGIGNFNDDIARLEAAVAYLRRHAEVPDVSERR